MPWHVAVVENLPAVFAAPWVNRAWRQPVAGQGPQVELDVPRQRLKFPRYQQDMINSDGKLEPAQEAYVNWRKRYINYLIDELCRGVTRAELCRELVNNIDGLASPMLLDLPLARRNDNGNPVAVVADPNQQPPIIGNPIRASGLDEAVLILDRYFGIRDEVKRKNVNRDLEQFYRPHNMTMQAARVHFEHNYNQANVIGGTTWSANYKAQKWLEKVRISPRQEENVMSRVDGDQAQFDRIVELTVQLVPMLTEAESRAAAAERKTALGVHYEEYVDEGGTTWYGHGEDASVAETWATSSAANWYPPAPQVYAPTYHETVAAVASYPVASTFQPVVLPQQHQSEEIWYDCSEQEQQEQQEQEQQQTIYVQQGAAAPMVSVTPAQHVQPQPTYVAGEVVQEIHHDEETGWYWMNEEGYFSISNGAIHYVNPPQNPAASGAIFALGGGDVWKGGKKGGGKKGRRVVFRKFSARILPMSQRPPTPYPPQQGFGFGSSGFGTMKGASTLPGRPNPGTCDLCGSPDHWKAQCPKGGKGKPQFPGPPKGFSKGKGFVKGGVFGKQIRFIVPICFLLHVLTAGFRHELPLKSCAVNEVFPYDVWTSALFESVPDESARQHFVFDMPWTERRSWGNEEINEIRNRCRTHQEVLFFFS